MNEYKYLSDGQTVTVVQKLDKGWLVQTLGVAEDNEGEYTVPHELKMVNEVFETPPRGRYHEDIQALKDTVDSLNEKIQERRKELSEAQLQLKSDSKEQAATLENVKRHEALKYIEEFIDGKITHYVDITYSEWNIIPLNEATDTYDGKDLRLLTLYGKSKGDLQWRLGSYSDHSGGSSFVTPCRFYEEALAVLQEKLNAVVAEGFAKTSYQEAIVQNADEWGLNLPVEYRQKVTDDKQKAALAGIADKKEVLAEARRAYDRAFEGELI